MRSLQGRLSFLALACIALVALPFFVLTYAKIVEEVDELSDARLAQNARTIETLFSHSGFKDKMTDVPLVVGRLPPNDADPQSTPYETEIGFQYWSNPAHLQLATADMQDLAFNAAPSGFSDITKDGRRWRVFTLRAREGFIRAAERDDSRREIAHDLLLQNTAPLLLGLPLLALLIGWAVRRGLRPLADVTRNLQARAPDELDPLSVSGAPAEIQPLLDALNALLGRVRCLLDNERQFTANAAHELRTPLAGALVNLDNALAVEDRDAGSLALGEARSALERMRHIVNQMLELARWDNAPSAHDFGPVDLGHCVDEELAALGGALIERDIEIVRSIDAAARCVRGWEPGLRAMIRNLLDNALRYGFEHGRIDIEIALRDGRSLLAISDFGPGLPSSQRTSMLERFRRGVDAAGEGSGLGLSIVTRIAHVHGASVRLLDPPDHHGLRVEIGFRSAAAAYSSRPDP